MELAAVFKEGMILQQNRINRIWGRAGEGEKIEIEFLDKHYLTQADNGEWHIDLEPAKVGGPYEMTVKGSASGEVVFKDILVGEVWFAGGQSNMELELQNSDNGVSVCENADNDWIRFYNVPKHAMVDDELIEIEKSTCWKKACGMQIADVSAVAFYFAKKLYEVLQVPIGIIDCYLGGTSATCWVPEESLSDISEVSGYIDEWKEVIASKSDEQYEAEMKDYNARVDEWNAKVEKLRADDPDISWEKINEAAGSYPWPQPKGASSLYRPFGLYESMVRRVVPYGIKGFIYYQAEEDRSRAACYAKLNQAVIDCWREDFSLGEKEDIPFIITQLPMFAEKGNEAIDDFETLRMQQEQVFLQNDNMGMAVIIDCGEYDNVHPTDKETPGNRLALQALGRFYGKIERFDNMRAREVNFCNDVVIVAFDNTYGELRARYADAHTLTARYEETEVPAKILPSEKILGFEISGDGTHFYPAKVLVVGEKIKLSCDSVKTPKAVRYGVTEYGVVNLYNAAGLPLAPFIYASKLN